MESAPRHRFSLAVARVRMAWLGLALLAGCLSVVWLALRMPYFGVALAPAGDHALQVVAAAPGTGLAPGQQLAAVRIGAQWQPLHSRLLVEEPDLLGTWAEYDALLQQLNAVSDELSSSGRLRVRLTDGEERELRPERRPLGAIPWPFWQQLAVAILGYLLTTGVWVFRPRERAAAFYALTGVTLTAAILAASVYSSREWLIDGDLLRALSLINHAGALLFTAALAGLLWYYPKRLGRAPVPTLAVGFMVLAWLSDLLRLAPDLASAQYLPILILFSGTFLLAAWQWWVSRADPVARAALKWYLLSVFVGTSLFAGLQMLPAALGAPPLANQATLFLGFLIMFGGIALGLTRYRLFELERWWFRTWAWVLGGLGVIGLDLLLVGQLHLTHNEGLALALIAAGWVYFPLRQWLIKRLWPSRPDSEARSAGLIAALASADDAEAVSRVWMGVLRDAFQPLRLEPAAGPAGLSSDGQHLVLPPLGEGPGLCISYPDRGLRLFRPGDRDQALWLHRLASAVHAGRGEADRARHEERSRIQRDLHDDLGARLLSLVYAQDVAESSVLARSALKDLREVLTALDESAVPLEAALAAWRAESEERCLQAGLELAWQVEGLTAAAEVGGRLRANLGRILREALSNVVRHAAARRVVMSFELAGDGCRFEIRDDGCGGNAPDGSSGLGGRVMRRRAEELGGWLRTGPQSEGGFAVCGFLPWQRSSEPQR